jgi:hypothetical protein
MEKLKETKVYVIDLSDDSCDSVDIGGWNNLSDEKWIELSESQGQVFSLKGFQNAFNREEISYDVYLRFITN